MGGEGFIGELFKLTGAFLPPPPGVQPPPLWGVEMHIAEVFDSAGVVPLVERESLDFEFTSADEAVRRYAEDFGPFVLARAALEPQGRWDEFLSAFAGLVQRFNAATDGTARIRGDYLLITIDR